LFGGESEIFLATLFLNAPGIGGNGNTHHHNAHVPTNHSLTAVSAGSPPTHTVDHIATFLHRYGETNFATGVLCLPAMAINTGRTRTGFIEL